VDNDQTLVWLMAKDYSHGIFHQPFVYGQDYNYMLEALVAIPFLWCKVPVEVALPLVTNMLAIAPFVSFAFYYKSKGRVNAALLLLAIPLLLPNSFALITSMPRGFINGLAFFTLWPWIERIRNYSLQYVAYGGLLAAALVVNPNVIFIAVVLAGLQYNRAEHRKSATLFFLVGASVPALLHVLALRWAAYHSDQMLHFAWSLEWTIDYFKQAFSGPQFSYFKGVVPFTTEYAEYMWFIFPLFMFYAFWKQNYLLSSLLGLVCVGVIVSLGINKVNDGTQSVFFPLSRMFLALPLVLAVVVSELISENEKSYFRFAILIVAGITLGFNMQNLNSDIAKEVNDRSVPLSVKSIAELRMQTDQLNAFAKTNSVFYFAGMGYPMDYGEFQVIFYSGAAWHDDFPIVALPEYERRKWESRKIADISAQHTVWFGGQEFQWNDMSSVAGVEAYDILNLRGYRVTSLLTHREVLRYHGKSSVIGE